MHMSMEGSYRKRLMENAGTAKKKISLNYFPPLTPSSLFHFSRQHSPQWAESIEIVLSVLPCIRAVGWNSERIEANALADLSARNIAILQTVEVDKHLVRAREFGAERAGEETGRAGEADVKGTELSASARPGVGEAGRDGAGWDGGGVSLSIAECTVALDEYLLTAGNENV